MNNKLQEMFFDNLEVKYKSVSEIVRTKINEELNFIKDKKLEKTLRDMVSLINNLKEFYLFELNIDNDNYTITGSINNLFVSYILGITKFNPLDYETKIPNDIEITLSLPENILNRLLIFLKKKLTKINYHNHILIINSTKIKVEEKSILTILNNIYLKNDFIINYNKETINKLNEKIKVTEHQTTYEEIFTNKEIYKSNIEYIEQEQKEFELAYFKYFYPRLYFFESIKYFMNFIDTKILKYYLNNYDKAIEYYQSKKFLSLEEEYVLSFYKLCKTAKIELPDFFLDIDKLKPVLKNIIFIETRVGNDMMKTLINIMLYYNKNNKKSILFPFDGNCLWYTSKFIAIDTNLNYKSIYSFLNPFYVSKLNDNIDEKKIINSICNFQKTNIFISNNESSIDEIVLQSSKYDVIVIDSFDYLFNASNYNLNECLELLNNLNKEIIIFERPKNKYRISEDIKIEDIKNLFIKRKYTRGFYSNKTENNQVIIKNMFGSDKYVI